MTNIDEHGDDPEQNQTPSDEIRPLDNHASSGDIVAAITTLATPTAIAAGIKYGLQSWDNHVTQQAETRREQIRQDGETARAAIAAAQTSAPPDEPARPAQ
ncbi:hypothetical protein [Streptomyces sp. NPDC047976]|uniref:hypothetical protein n=1 Tax=unclassified Streptomyces TaxID=2593676 RepID=UPI00342F9521